MFLLHNIFLLSKIYCLFCGSADEYINTYKQFLTYGTTRATFLGQRLLLMLIRNLASWIVKGPAETSF